MKKLSRKGASSFFQPMKYQPSSSDWSVSCVTDKSWLMLKSLCLNLDWIWDIKLNFTAILLVFLRKYEVEKLVYNSLSTVYHFLCTENNIDFFQRSGDNPWSVQTRKVRPNTTCVNTGKKQTRNSSVFWHFSRSVRVSKLNASAIMSCSWAYFGFSPLRIFKTTSSVKLTLENDLSVGRWESVGILMSLLIYKNQQKNKLKISALDISAEGL